MANYKMMRSFAYSNVNALIPRVTYNMLRQILKEQGKPFNKWIFEKVAETIREHFGQDNYEAMMEHIDKYYPPKKNKEAEDYWNAMMDKAAKGE